MLNKTKSQLFAIALLAASCGLNSPAFANKLDPSIQVEKRIDKAAATTQERINRLAEDTLDINAEYKSLLTRIEQFKAYNRRLEISIEGQNEEMASIQAQMDTIDDTERGLMPLMDEMINRLADFVELDVPFKEDIRADRISDLRDIMLRADVSTSEKYRQILNAYVQEIAYGNDVAVYEGTQDINGVERQVDFLQFGRTALMFVTRGENPAAAIYGGDGWIPLQDGAQIDAVRKAIRDVNLKSKKLIVVPVATPEK